MARLSQENADLLLRISGATAAPNIPELEAELVAVGATIVSLGIERMAAAAASDTVRARLQGLINEASHLGSRIQSAGTNCDRPRHVDTITGSVAGTDLYAASPGTGPARDMEGRGSDGGSGDGEDDVAAGQLDSEDEPHPLRRRHGKSKTTDILGWTSMDDDEMQSLGFLEVCTRSASGENSDGGGGGSGKNDVTRQQLADQNDRSSKGSVEERVSKLRWRDRASDAPLAAVHEFSTPSMSLRRKVRSRAGKKVGSDQAKRSHHRRTRDDGTKQQRADAHLGRPPCTCGSLSLVGPTGIRVEVAAPASFDIGRNTLGLDSGKIHRAHIRVAFVQGRWAAQLLGTNPAYVQPDVAETEREAGAEAEAELTSSAWHRIDGAPGWTNIHHKDILFCSKRLAPLATQVLMGNRDDAAAMPPPPIAPAPSGDAKGPRSDE